MTTTAEIIKPIMTEVYGDSRYVTAMVNDIALIIDVPDPVSAGHNRENTIFRALAWNWGKKSTESSEVARRIEAALVEAGS